MKFRLVAMLAMVVSVSACSDRIPTLSDVGRFPPGTLPTTLQHILSPAEILIAGETYVGATGPIDGRNLLVANQFEGSLTSHALVRFGPFPEAIEVGTLLDSAFTYVAARVVATVPDSLGVSASRAEFGLWAMPQAWQADATWESAGGGVGWQTPGGTRSELLGSAMWTRADTTAAGDSLIWDISPDVVRAMAAGQIQGVMVTMFDAGVRAEISRLTLITEVVSTVLEDSVLVRGIGSGPQTFVFTPEPPRPPDAFRVGGITADRSLIRLNFDHGLPVCLDVPEAECTERVDLEEVILSRVDLLLDPLPVPLGFRPLAPLLLVIRNVVEPELGARAPLGSYAFIDTLSVESFSGGAPEPIRFVVTGSVASAIRRGSRELSLALLVEPDASSFSYAFFAQNPRLRFIYTLPTRPELP